MSKKKKLIPELRFPDFKNEGEWNYDKIDNLFHLQDGYAFSSNAFTDSKLNTKQVIRITDINNQNKNGDKVFVLEETTKALGVEKYKVKKGDLLLSLTGAAGFNFFIWESDDAYINQRTMKLNPKKKENDSLKVILEPLVHSKINEIGTGQNNNLSKDALKEIEFPYPNPKEQQKIASCLSSLDELIAAHKDKLDALKDHKKGLMQNLFPQEGEKVPKLRFKEFEKDGEWELKPFSKFIKLYRGSSPRPIREYLTKEETGVNWIKIGDTSSITDFVIRSVSEKITPKGAEKSRRVKKGELILANSMSYGSTYLLEVEGCIYDGWFVLREYEEHFDKQFLLQLLNSEYTQGQYKRFAAGGIVQNISSEIVYSITLSKTSKEEQQKIASCLSAVDELITAQQEKIEQLQQHKKGLMQGLFPKIND